MTARSGVPTHEPFPGPGEPPIPQLADDQTTAPRPEEEIADQLRSEPDPHAPTLRLATSSDLDVLAAHDRHLRVERLSASIEAGHVLVVEEADGILGWLRWGYFWDEIPFMNMLFVLEPARGRGLGGRLVEDWEARARADGHDAVMTSTRSDETAQHFYRRRGYVEVGVLLLPGEPAELILRKELP